MADPVIVFNSSTGSDSLASGAGPASAVTGSSASPSGTIVDVSGDSPDLSSIAVDGSAVLFVNSASGRKFAAIAAVDNTAKTITCSQSFASGSGLSWAVGGKRSTFDSSSEVFPDADDNWTIETETDQDVTQEFQLTSGATGVTVRAASGVMRTLDRTNAPGSNEGLFHLTTANGSWSFEDLKMQNSFASGTKAYGVRCSRANSPIAFRGCVLGDPVHKLRTAIHRQTQACQFWVIESVIQHCTGRGLYQGGSSGHVQVATSCFKNNGSDGLYDASQTAVVVNNIFANNGTRGAYLRAAYCAIGNVAHGNSHDGMQAGTSTASRVVGNNVATNNGRYGFTINAHNNLGNATFGNATAAYSPTYASGQSSNDIALASLPYEDAVAENFLWKSDSELVSYLKAISATNSRPYGVFSPQGGGVTSGGVPISRVVN